MTYRPTKPIIAITPDETLMRQMAEHQPTIFISIPMKWIQLFESIGAESQPNATFTPARSISQAGAGPQPE